MKLLRPLFATLLALTLSLASVTLASARGQAPVSGEIVICSGLGLQTITIDADGNPVGSPHICPDGVASFVSIDVIPPVLPQQPSVVGKRLVPLQALVRAGEQSLRATARAPPALS
ncbi:hypothetical protein [Actibacterium lipolyticum]|uniref:DUF2946 domain-containing protein n=1 Tax=Actibacterium lipolyticum TaxID=1524263 RepID=A0A238JNK4_9RHOB|nr:hypothetical protein [Actibacterium lipolyticum]SMX32013.1 hypothetical protein COL8621_00682 [Actibacterium lipolyticum]